MAKRKNLPPIMNTTHFDLAQGALERVRALKPVIQAAKNLGVDVSDYEKAAKSLEEWHAAFMAEWFPGGKPK